MNTDKLLDVIGKINQLCFEALHPMLIMKNRLKNLKVSSSQALIQN